MTEEFQEETWGYSETYLNFESKFINTPHDKACRLLFQDNMNRMLDPCNPCGFMGDCLRQDSRHAFLLATQAY